MINLHRDITVLLKYEFMTENIIRQQVEILNKLLVQTESQESFCIAHELVDRNRIISNKKKVLKESCFINLRPFRFLINKN